MIRTIGGVDEQAAQDVSIDIHMFARRKCNYVHTVPRGKDLITRSPSFDASSNPGPTRRERATIRSYGNIEGSVRL